MMAPIRAGRCGRVKGGGGRRERGGVAASSPAAGRRRRGGGLTGDGVARAARRRRPQQRPPRARARRRPPARGPAQLVEDVHEAAEEHGYDLVLSTVTRPRDEGRAIETLLDSRCEGLVLLGPDAPAARLSALAR